MMMVKTILYFTFWCNLVNEKTVQFYVVVNPLTPRIDQHETSPCNILTLSGKQAMRIFKLLR